MPKNPLGKLKDAADLVVGAAVGTVVDTGQKAAGAVGAVTSMVPGRKKPVKKSPDPKPAAEPAVKQEESTRPHGDPLKPVQKVVTKKAPAKKAPAKKAPASTAPAKKAPAPAAPAQTASSDSSSSDKPLVTKAPATKAPAAKQAAKKAPAKKAPVK